MKGEELGVVPSTGDKIFLSFPKTLTPVGTTQIPIQLTINPLD
jgi:hypothetical protein